MIENGGMAGDGGSTANWSNDEWALRLGAILILVTLAATFSGLTLGLMGLDKVGLEIVIATGSEPNATAVEKMNAKHANKIQPIRKDGHLLLTTLLFGNVAVNSIMAILMADMTSALLSLSFGELIPQALCSKHPLAIGAKALPILYVLIGTMYLFAKPIAMLLDWLVGKDCGTLFSKCELEKMLDIHVKQKKLDPDELGIMKGAMYYKQTPVGNVMTPIANVYTLPGSTILDLPQIESIYAMGFSRVPVYGRDINDILGVIFVKDLIFVNPEERSTMLDFMHLFGRSVHRVWPDSSLGDVLQAFKMGRTHLAIVHEVNNSSNTDPFYETQGVVTLEDIIEEILQSEIYDEGDVVDSEMAQRNRLTRRPSFDTGVRHVIDNNTVWKSISEPEAMSLAKHLVATCNVFRIPGAKGVGPTASSVAAMLMRCPVLEYQPADDHPPLYELNIEANFCLIVMQGRVFIESTDSTPSIESGLWSILAPTALIQTDRTYVSENTIRIPQQTYASCLRISRLEFQAMLRPGMTLATTHKELSARHLHRRQSSRKASKSIRKKTSDQYIQLKEDQVGDAVIAYV